MATTRMTMAQALIRFIDQQYFSIDGRIEKFVEGVFAIFGHGNVCGLGEALEYSEHGLKFIRGNNEQGMAHAATAFAKQNNRIKIYAVTTSIGPGATNLVTAAATATINRLPLLLLPGDVFASRAPDPVLQQLEHPWSHDLSVNDCLRPVSKYFDRINRPEQLMTALVKAFKVLTDPALTGTVTLALPQDVQCESYDFPTSFFKQRVHVFERQTPCLDKIEEAAQFIRHSEKPLIIVGGGAAYSFAEKSLLRFSEEYGIPLCETQAGKGIIPYDSALNLGGVGVMGSMAANRLAQEADCIIAVGTRLSDFVTCSKTAFRNDRCRFISINIDPFDAIKLEPEISLCADAKLAVEALHASLSSTSFTVNECYVMRVKEEKQRWLSAQRAALDGKVACDTRLDQLQVLACLNQECDDNAIVVAAAGSLPGDLQRFWYTKSYKGYHLEYGYSCMGYEVAGALGAKMAEPDREVWALVGDGSFLMMHSEIVTAVQEHLKINILLFDSSGFNCIKGLQCAMGSQGYGTDLRFRSRETNALNGDVIPIDFAMLARGLGLETYRAHSMEDLPRIIACARASKNSTLIEVKIRQGSQSSGYDAWWNVAVSDTSASSAVVDAHARMVNDGKQARY